jgi:hypothetical protein
MKNNQGPKLDGIKIDSAIRSISFPFQVFVNSNGTCTVNPNSFLLKSIDQSDKIKIDLLDATFYYQPQNKLLLNYNFSSQKAKLSMSNGWPFIISFTPHNIPIELNLVIGYFDERRVFFQCVKDNLILAETCTKLGTALYPVPFHGSTSFEPDKDYPIINNE